MAVSNKLSFRTKRKNVCLCEVCTQLMNDPRVLPCGHSFCKDCVDNWHRTNSYQGGSNASSCPYCRRIFVLDLRGADGLPKNFQLKAAIDLFQITEARKEATSSCENENFTCEKCKATFGEIKTCVYCDKNLCLECAKKHEDNDCLLERNEIENPKSKTKFCQLHPSQRLELYCTDHDIPICNSCGLTQHKNHHLTNISTAGEERRKYLAELEDDCNKSLQCCDTTDTELQGKRIQLKVNYDKATNGVDDLIRNITSILQEKKESCLQELKGNYERIEDEIQTEIDDNRRRKENLESLCVHVKRLRTDGSALDILQDTFHQSKLAEIKHNKKSDMLNFDIDIELDTFTILDQCIHDIKRLFPNSQSSISANPRPSFTSPLNTMQTEANILYQDFYGIGFDEENCDLEESALKPPCTDKWGKALPSFNYKPSRPPLPSRNIPKRRDSLQSPRCTGILNQSVVQLGTEADDMEEYYDTFQAPTSINCRPRRRPPLPIPLETEAEDISEGAGKHKVNTDEEIYKEEDNTELDGTALKFTCTDDQDTEEYSYTFQAPTPNNCRPRRRPPPPFPLGIEAEDIYKGAGTHNVNIDEEIYGEEDKSDMEEYNDTFQAPKYINCKSRRRPLPPLPPGTETEDISEGAGKQTPDTNDQCTEIYNEIPEYEAARNEPKVINCKKKLMFNVEVDVTGIAVSDEGEIFVASKTEPSVPVFNSDGKLLSVIKSKAIKNPFDLTIARNAHDEEYRKVVFLTDHGETTFGIKMIRKQKKNYKVADFNRDVKTPQGITSLENQLIVCDAKPKLIKIFDITTRCSFKIINGNQGELLFNTPWYISTYPIFEEEHEYTNTELILTDSSTKSVLVLSYNGKLKRIYDKSTFSDSFYPTKTSVDHVSGTLYIADQGNGEIFVVRHDDITKLAYNTFRKKPIAMDFDKNHNLWVASRKGSFVRFQLP